MKYNKGFASLILLAIIVGALVVGGGAYYLGKSSKIENKEVRVEENNLPSNPEKNDDNSIPQKVLSNDTIVSPRSGMIYPPYPKDVINSFGGGVIIDSSNNTTDYGIDRVQTSDGYELWLNRINKRNNNVVLNYTALDSISIPSNKMSSYVYLGLCGKKDTTSSNGDLVRDYTIVVLLDADEFYSKGSAPALRVWKANLKSEKFENYSPSGISCINEEVN